MKKILESFIKLISYNASPVREEFVLEENRFDRAIYRSAGGDSGDSGDSGEAGKRRGGRLPRKTRRDGIHTSLDQNRGEIENIFGLPVNKDIILREFNVGTCPPAEGFIVFIDGLADRITINSMLQSLMLHTRMFRKVTADQAKDIMKNILPGGQVRVTYTFKETTEAVNNGDTAFFFEGSASAVVAETKGWEHRTVDRPNLEQTISGPQEAFVENLRVNTGLVRKIVRSENLYTEFIKIGKRFYSDVAVMYINDLASPDLVREVKRRISSITVDYVSDVGMLEQLIEDDPYNLNPQTMTTERPDRVASYLAEGRVAVILSGSPYALVAPATMYSQLHTGEETYLRWQYGTFIRYVRNFAFYIALLLPGSYLAIVLYHQEMIPTELLLAIAGNRERVPFPTVVEMLLMEFSFELVREAGLRIPGIIGSTIGIVGALILGQAAVQANIVSPILVILVAVTGLASFSIPNYSLSFALRIYRFFYIFMGAILGFYGIAIGLFVQILLTANLKSFGVPYLSPIGARTCASPDIVYRFPIFLHHRRPDYINPQDDLRMPEEPRGWIKEGPSGGGQG
ncbi:MAG: spore germination protein [Bacillota bacterium]